MSAYCVILSRISPTGGAPPHQFWNLSTYRVVSISSCEPGRRSIKSTLYRATVSFAETADVPAPFPRRAVHFVACWRSVLRTDRPRTHATLTTGSRSPSCPALRKQPSALLNRSTRHYWKRRSSQFALRLKPSRSRWPQMSLANSAATGIDEDTSSRHRDITRLPIPAAP